MSFSPSSKNKKDKIMIIGIGSFCDGNLMENIVSQLHQKHNKIYYFTDDASYTAKSPIKPTEIFHSPNFLISDPLKNVGDPNTPLILSLLTQPFQFMQIFQWIKYLENTIYAWEQKYKPDKMIIHYGLLFVLLFIELKQPGYLSKIPRFVCYFSPNIVNQTLPWLFDSRLRDPEYKLYAETKKNKEIALNSWHNNFSRFHYAWFFSDNRENTFAQIMPLMNQMEHLLCWDKNHIQNIDYMVDKKKIHHIGGLYPSPSLIHFMKNINVKHELHKYKLKDIISFLFDYQTQKKIAFITFGSISQFPLLNKAMNDTAYVLVENGYKVIIHKTFADKDSYLEDEVYKHPDIYVHQGYLPYEVILPILSLVVFTGSLCLQLLCLYQKVPMLFYPVTNEQYFWAKNYKHFTKIPYIDFLIMQKKTIREQMEHSIKCILRSPTLALYLQNVSTDIKKRNPHILLQKIKNM